MVHDFGASGIGGAFADMALLLAFKSREYQNDDAVEDPQHQAQDSASLLRDTGQLRGGTLVSAHVTITTIMAKPGLQKSTGLQGHQDAGPVAGNGDEGESGSQMCRSNKLQPISIEHSQQLTNAVPFVARSGNRLLTLDGYAEIRGVDCGFPLLQHLEAAFDAVWVLALRGET